MNAFDYDIIVIGGGAAGLTAAKLAKGFGKKVALIEKDKLGGECTWTGCIPSKTLIKSAYGAHIFNNLSRFGITNKQAAQLDTSSVFSHIRSVVHDIYKTHTPEILANQGIEVIFSQPSFIDNHHIGLDHQTIAARSFIIATGSVPVIPPVEGIENVPYLTNRTLFSLERLPKSLMVLGGGALGVEMACALNRLGVNVTIVEMQQRILHTEDKECVELLSQRLCAEGVTIVQSARASCIEQKDNRIVLTVTRSDGSEYELNAEQLLVAVGRKPQLEGLYVERAGVLAKKHLQVDEYLRTTAPNIYACGDVIGPYHFSHMAFVQATVAVRNACIPLFKKKMDYRHVSWALFTDPEFASAGLTEEQARDVYGDRITIYRYDYAQLDRAHTEGDTFGLGKFICDKRGRLIGAHILGARAGELISEIQGIKTFNHRFADLFHVIHPYPTYSEVLWHAAKKRYIDTLKENVGIHLMQTFMRWIKK